MYQYPYEEPEGEISLKELFWDLLTQWKAILIVSLIFAAIAPAAKYFLDLRDYKKASAEYEDTAAQLIDEADQDEELSIDELRKISMADLSDQERATLEHLDRLEEVEAVQQEYLENSILMKIDPANQRTLSVRYLLHREGDYALQALVDAYNIYLARGEVADKLGEVIAPELERKYVFELYSSGGGSVVDNYVNDTVYSVNVTLPDGVDEAAVLPVVDSVISSAQDALNGSMGPHSISRFYFETQTRYNKGTADSKLNWTNGLNTIRDNIKKIEDALTDEQKVAHYGSKALKAIQESRTEEEAAKAKEDSKAAVDEDILAKPVKPRINLFYAVVGLLGGAFLYACVYFGKTVLGGSVRYGEGLEEYTACRVLGEVRYSKKHTGLSKLLHSAWVDKRRYRGKPNLDEQIDRIASTAKAVSDHAGVSELTLLRLSAGDGEVAKTAQLVSSAIEAQGITVRRVEFAPDADEKLLLDVSIALFVVDESCKYRHVWQSTLLCRDYDVRPQGCIFIRER